MRDTLSGGLVVFPYLVVRDGIDVPAIAGDSLIRFRGGDASYLSRPGLSVLGRELKYGGVDQEEQEARCDHRPLRAKSARAFWKVHFNLSSVGATVASLVVELQSKLDDARREGTGDRSTAERCSGTANRGTGRRRKVRVIEEIVELCAELDLDPIPDRAERFIECQIRIVVVRPCTGVASKASERARQGSG